MHYSVFFYITAYITLHIYLLCVEAGNSYFCSLELCNQKQNLLVCMKTNPVLIHVVGAVIYKYHPGGFSLWHLH